ncbi:CBS domain-containing protein [Candidatus Albibeggiatoa sp. nov. NOAA]|uniref:CBS domain-containing protein n=1 Tax=Candidatus Albibeggiatoa sp. nov. NOAA TaxID=3162724 RepID=UPI0032FEE6CF|nr:CBS domain-containing protein [Thiotrichaceae bacterium]
MSDENSIVRVRDVMKTEFDRIDGTSTVSEILGSMQHPEVRLFVVNKRDENDEFGMLLLSEIAREVLAKDRSPERVNVYEIMVKPVITVSPNMDIRYCARLFNRFKVSRSLVVENDEVIGVVSFTDIVLRGMCNLYNVCPVG